MSQHKPSKNASRPAQRFVSRMVAGCVLAVLLGYNIDNYLHTTPWIMFALLLYVIIGSLYILVKETGDDSERK